MDVSAGMGEPVMATATSGVNREARREGAVAALKVGQRAEAAVVGIDVENDEPAVATGAEGDVGCRPLPPPAGDGFGVGGGVAEALRVRGCFAGLEQSARRQQQPDGVGSWQGNTAQPRWA